VDLQGLEKPMAGIGRREVLGVLGGAAVAWPLGARAQQADRPRRIGILQNLEENDRVGTALISAFVEELRRSGWTAGQNVHIETRWAGTRSDNIRRHAAELVDVAPDAILTNGTSTLGPLLQATRTIPIVFVQVTDPVGSGYVMSLARPGGNATGFTTNEYSASGKWLEVLKQAAPAVTRVGVIRNPAVPSGSGQFGAIQAVAPYLRVDVIPIDVRDPHEIELASAAMANAGNAGLVITANGAAVAHRDLIIAVAARHKLPAVYWQRHFVAAGGLVSYGDDGTDGYRKAATYVARILKGEKPADLPVQAPTKYELVINLKTAKTIGLEVPASFLARADEVIE
jgi:putative ABC transport system substrate-binding protein